MTTVDPTTIAETQLDLLERAWNEADGAAFGRVFSADTDFVDIRGTHHRGDVAVADGHQSLFDSIYAGSTIRYQLKAARAVAPQCIIAVAGATLDVPSGPMQGVSSSSLTAALTEHGGRWSVTAFQNTIVREGN